jgi:phenylacetate-CoA ligase
MEIGALPSPVNAFQRAAARVPAYGILLKEAGLDPDKIVTMEDFGRVPVLEKRSTFQRFPIAQLCTEGELGRLGSVLTSSGHSGIFAYGLTSAEAQGEAAQAIDELLDYIFQVRSRPTLLINCLPMGVKVHTEACTLAETSVRPDMVVGLVKAFGAHYQQIILVGEAAFVKHTLELGARDGVDWKNLLVSVIVGEEPLAENARKYIESLLSIDIARPETGIVASSMGVAELGLNLFSEVPPPVALVVLRRALHERAEFRQAVLGGHAKWVPSLFTYDPRRIFVEFDSAGRLLITTLDPKLRLPLIRYATGDCGHVLKIPAKLRPVIESLGLPWDLFAAIPIIAIQGRGDHALAGDAPVYPEVIKEGIYHDPELAPLTTANFRLISGDKRARIRIQLSPGITPSADLNKRFTSSIGYYLDHPFEVTCEAYETFGSGMTLDYERKFQYLGP